MAATTEKLTSRVQELVNEPVVMAVRIKPGKGSRIRNPFIRSAIAFLLFPLFPLYLIYWAVTRMIRLVVKSAIPPKPGVLALLAHGSYRIFATGASSMKPGVQTHEFGSETQLVVDHERFESSLQAEITLDDFVAVINGVDLKVLLRAASAGQVKEPELVRLAGAHGRYASSVLANQEVSELRDQLGLAEQLEDPVQ